MDIWLVPFKFSILPQGYAELDLFDTFIQKVVMKMGLTK